MQYFATVEPQKRLAPHLHMAVRGTLPRADGHRRFGNIRKLPSGRFQIRYPGPDGIFRTGLTTYKTRDHCR